MHLHPPRAVHFLLPQKHCAFPGEGPRAFLLLTLHPPASALELFHMKASQTHQPRSNVFLGCALRKVLLSLPALKSNLSYLWMVRFIFLSLS